MPAYRRNKRFIGWAGALIAATAPIASPLVLARENMSGEQELAKMLEGRVAGKPVNCIRLTDAGSSTIIPGVALVYNFGGTIYVNRPQNPESLRRDDILVTKPTNGEFCRLDIVTLREQQTFAFDGSLSLNEFVPYTRVPRS